MSRHIFPTLLAATVLLAGGLRADSAGPSEPIPNWPSPPFWSPGGARASKTGSQGLQTEGLQAASAPLPFFAVPPCRMLDTRVTGGPIASGFTRDATLTGPPCGIPANAVAVSANFVVFNITGATGNGVLKVFPAGSPSTFQALLNWSPSAGQLDNASVIPLGTGGAITLQPQQGGGSIDMVIDVNGYYGGSVVTDLTAGAGLAGGGTGSVALGIAPGGVTSTELAANAVTASKLAANAVTAGAIAPGQAVKSVNGATDAVSVVGSGATIVSTVGATITVGTPVVVPAGSFLLGQPNDTTLVAAGYTELGASREDAWKATSTVGAPSPRSGHVAVWTGTRMIVWGGNDGTATNTGGRYDPVSDSWTPTSTVGTPAARTSEVVVWTGSRMIVWGGFDAGAINLNTGGRYDPVADSWAPTSIVLAPTPRFFFNAVWTGSVMIVWGGENNAGDHLDTGGRYNPVTDTWAATTTSGAPAGRDVFAMVWSGTGMIVWGGFDGTNDVNTGGIYDPVFDSWTLLPTAGAPIARRFPAAVWTGTKMIVWGGSQATTSTQLNSGGLYDPIANVWAPTSLVGAPEGRIQFTMLWTGSKVIVWGGSGAQLVNTGFLYDPAFDGWSPMTLTRAPAARLNYSGVWTGNQMIVWGGTDFVTALNTGGRYSVLSLYVKN